MSRLIQKTVYVELTVEELALLFADLTDDDQAQFFCRVAERFRDFKDGGSILQIYKIGEHLRTCSCSTEDGREFVRGIHAAMEDLL